MSEPTPDELVTLVDAASVFEAQAIVAILRDAGIDALAVDPGSALALRHDSVPVRVRIDDEQRARAIFAEHRAAAATIGWDEVDVGERQDDLPLSRTDRMPLSARIALVVTIAVAAIALIGALVLAFG